MTKNSNKNLFDRIIKLFFYIAPLIGLLYGVYYLQTRGEKDNVTISKQRLERVIIEIVEDLDKENCINKKELEVEVKEKVSGIN